MDDRIHDEARDADFKAEVKREREVFLRELDGMIESTEEFIRDDNPTVRDLLGAADPEGRLADWIALEHVRKLYLTVFTIEGVKD